MPSILVHYCLTLDLTGYTDIDGSVARFLEQINLSRVKKSVEIVGDQCTVRFAIETSETLSELRQAVKLTARGLFSEVLKSAGKQLRERPSDLYLELKMRPHYSS